jgi:hypothetical protein
MQRVLFVGLTSDMDVCAYFEKDCLKTVCISKNGITLNLNSDEWQEIQDTMKGKNFALVSSKMDGYVPEMTLLKNKDKYKQ